MKFLMISSYLPSVLNFRGKFLEAIHAQGLEIHVLAPDLQDYPDELNQLQQLGYQVHTCCHATYRNQPNSRSQNF